MIAALYVLYVVNCLFLIMVVLLQAGKGDGMGAVFGGGGSNTLLGNRGAATFLSKLTVGSATMFMVLSVVLAFYSSNPGSRVGRGRIDPRQGPAGMGSFGMGGDEGNELPFEFEVTPTDEAATDEAATDEAATEDDQPADSVPDEGPTDEATSPEPGEGDEASPEPSDSESEVDDGNTAAEAPAEGEPGATAAENEPAAEVQPAEPAADGEPAAEGEPTEVTADDAPGEPAESEEPAPASDQETEPEP